MIYISYSIVTQLEVLQYLKKLILQVKSNTLYYLTTFLSSQLPPTYSGTHAAFSPRNQSQ